MEHGDYHIRLFVRDTLIYAEAYAPRPEKGQQVTVTVLSKVTRADSDQNVIVLTIPLDTILHNRAYGISHQIGVVNGFGKVTHTRSRLEYTKFKELFPLFDMAFTVT